MRLVLSIAMAWGLLDFFCAKVVLGVIAPIDQQFWEQIAHAVSVATR
jgi:hypothetical protein